MRVDKSTVARYLLILIFAFAIMHPQGGTPEALAQGPNTIGTVPPTLTPTPTPTSVPTEDVSEQILRLYGETIETSNKTVETMKWLMTVFLACVTVVISLVGGITVYRGKAAEDKAAEANAMASVAQKLFEGVEAKAKEIENAVHKVWRKVDDLDRITSDLDHDIQNAKDTTQELADLAIKVQSQVQEIAQQANKLRGTLGILDESDLRFLATLCLIDKHRRMLFISGDPGKREKAEWALVEKTHTNSPLICRESVIALSGIKKPSEAIIERFEEIVAEENDPEVKRLAEEALKRWESTA